MGITEKDLVIIDISDEMKCTSQYLAKKRIFFEYPRDGYGPYNESHVAKIEAGILGELAVFEHFMTILNDNYKHLKPSERWTLLQDKIRFSFKEVIGKVDDGNDFLIRDHKIDVKTYENNKVTIDQIFKGLRLQGKPLNLLIDCNQNSKADIYVQCFILEDDRIAISGYIDSLPPIQTWMPNAAHALPVPHLKSIHQLTELLIGEKNA